MRMVWTKSKLPVSLLIRAITGEEASHFSIVFESAAKGLMFESNLLGTHPKFFRTALKSLVVVQEKKFEVPIEVEDAIWDLVVQKYDGKSYDIKGALYLGWRILLQRAFKIPRPKVNAWGSPDRFFCNEVYEIFNSFPEHFPNIEVINGMDTPHDIWEKLKDWSPNGIS